MPDDKDLFVILVTTGIFHPSYHIEQEWVWGRGHKTFEAFPGLLFLQSRQLQVETLQRLCQRTEQG